MNAVETPEVEPVYDAVREMREQLREAGETPERAKARTAAYAQARREYPNHWAAIREVWDGARLIEPLVVVADPTFAGLKNILAQMPAEKKAGVVLELLGPVLRATYFLPPGCLK